RRPLRAGRLGRTFAPPSRRRVPRDAARKPTLGAQGHAHLPRTEGHAAGPPGVRGRTPHPLEERHRRRRTGAGRVRRAALLPQLRPRRRARGRTPPDLGTHHQRGVPRQHSGRAPWQRPRARRLEPALRGGEPRADPRARPAPAFLLLAAQPAVRRRVRRRLRPSAGDRGRHARVRDLEEELRARQAARSALPNSTETKIVVTGNARAWRHFLEMRGSATAEAEIRELALKVLEVLRAEAPNLFGDYRVVEQPNGFRVIETDYPR